MRTDLTVRWSGFQLAAALGVAAACLGSAAAQGWIVAEGGGALTRSDWQSPIFPFMVEKAGRGATVAILGVPGEPVEPDDKPPTSSPASPPAPPQTAGTDKLAQKFREAGFGTVYDLRIGKGDAENPQVARKIAESRVVFIRGGSQSEYVLWWKGTSIERAVRGVFDSGGVVGGTSAGCAVLGEYIYDAIGGSCSPKEALRDPFSPRLTFTTDFLRLTPGVLFDTHFTERARLGRLPVMLARLHDSAKPEVLGVGVDPRTAFCIGPDGVGEVLGPGTVTLMRLTAPSTIVLMAGRPPTVTEVSYTSLINGHRYDTRACRVLAPKDVEAKESRPGGHTIAPSGNRSFKPSVLQGSDVDDALAGAWVPAPMDDPKALNDANLSLGGGRNWLPGCVVQTRTFDGGELTETRIGAALWTLTQQPGLLALLLTRGNGATAGADGRIAIDSPPTTDRDGSQGAAPASAVLIEAAGATGLETGKQKWNERAKGPRQSASIRGAVVHVLAPGWMYDARTHRVAQSDAGAGK